MSVQPFGSTLFPVRLFKRRTYGVRERNELCSQPEHEFLAVAPAEDELQRFAKHAGEIHTTITLLPLEENGECAADWSDFPPQLAVRLFPPESALVVVTPLQGFSKSGTHGQSESDLPCPVWEWLIRQADRGCEVRLSNALACPAPTAVPTVHPRLIPESPDESRRWLLPHLHNEQVIPAPKSAADAIALRAGLLQIHDFLDASHRQSQSVEGAGRHASGDYWHAIMHRREPDYSNSKYWFRRVGVHPLFVALAERAEQVLRACPSPESAHWRETLVQQAGWDPMAFVDLCAACAGAEESPLGVAAREIQWHEMRLLLQHTYHDAVEA